MKLDLYHKLHKFI